MRAEPVMLPHCDADPTVPNPERQFVNFTVTTPGAATMSFFLGPKDFEELKAVDQQLVRAIDFGIFAAIIVPLLGALKSIYGYTGNYGWAIIILTILINLAIFPLRHRSMVSMRKMQALQPAVKAIQDRYAKYKITDPERQKMNQEMMALYKQKGVNPASGCLPMLLTMPILFAFYSLLSVAIELRAPFWLDHGPGPARSALHHAHPDGREHVLAAEDDADDGRPDSAEGVSADASHLHRVFPVGAGRTRGVLVREQPAGHRTAVPHQPDDRRPAPAPCGRPWPRRGSSPT
jgi:YidC/Oxa1 family membrane protein insertase